jgi:hypothetical protein
MLTRRLPLRRVTATAALLLTIELTGCSGGTSSTTQPSTQPPASSTRTSTGATTTPAATHSATSSTRAPSGRPTTPIGAASAAASAHPSGQATCSALTASRVSQLLGRTVTAQAKDHRQGDVGQHQLDGCSYTGADGIRLDYLIWQLPSAGTRATVLRGLPPQTPGVHTFAPGVGTVSAGTVLTSGPVATAQVNAVRQERLIQVSATAGTEDAARSAATAAAGILIGG